MHAGGANSCASALYQSWSHMYEAGTFQHLRPMTVICGGSMLASAFTCVCSLPSPM